MRRDLFTEDHEAFRELARDFVEKEVVPHYPEWEKGGRMPRDVFKHMGSLGMLGMAIPEEYGGGGAPDYRYNVVLQEEAARALVTLSTVRTQLEVILPYFLHYANEEQRKRWFPGLAAGTLLTAVAMTEPGTGSDLAGMRTSAVRDGDDWILNGTKMWITNGSVADVAVVWAQTDLEEGAKGIRGFVVPTDTPGFSAPEIHSKLSLRASVTSELVLDGVRLPASAMLPKAKGLRGPLTSLGEARFGIVFGAIGAARDCLETAIEYAQSREVFDKPLAGYQLTQAKIADMALEVGKGHLLAYHLGRMKDRGEIAPEQVSLGKLNNVREAIAVARECRTILGANGITLEYPVIRHANNLESVLTYEGTSEVHQLTIGKALTGEAAFR